MNGVHISELKLPRLRNARFINQFGWPQEVVIVGITGQMTATKGHEDFLIAAKISAAENSLLRFVIGSRPLEPMFSRIKELIKEYRLEDRVAFSGWLPTPQDFFSAIDILVMASRHDEGFGLVVAEAMERGAMVVATRSGGAVEIIEDGVSGYLIAKQEPNEMAESLLQLSGNPDMRNQVAVAGRARVETHFNLRTQARVFESELIRYV
jgi:glycosyltransferase involved in cell wall biosynthesis